METKKTDGNGQSNASNASSPGIYAETPAASDKTNIIVKQGDNFMPLAVDLTGDDLPNLDEAEVIPFDLSSQYWTPQAEGETKRVFFLKIEERPVQDQEDKDNKDAVKQLPCAFFLEKDTSGAMNTICNGSKRLVAIIENNKLERGAPLQITYKGKRKNNTNAFKSDDWLVKPLLIKLPAATTDDAANKQ